MALATLPKLVKVLQRFTGKLYQSINYSEVNVNVECAQIYPIFLSSILYCPIT